MLRQQLCIPQGCHKHSQALQVVRRPLQLLFDRPVLCTAGAAACLYPVPRHKCLMKHKQCFHQPNEPL